MRIELQKKLVIGIEVGSEHSYIFGSGKKIDLISWGKEIDAKEKHRLLDWPPSRIIKTIFFDRGDSKIYGVVLPLDKKIELKSLADYIKLSKRESSKLKLSKRLTYLQKPGSVAPFICDKDLSLIEKIVFEEEVYKGKVDFSYPGRPDVSIQMDYEDAIEILLEKYYDKIEIGKVSSTLEEKEGKHDPIYRVRYAIYRDRESGRYLEPESAIKLVEEGEIPADFVSFLVSDADKAGGSEIGYETAEKLGIIKQLKKVMKTLVNYINSEDILGK